MSMDLLAARAHAGKATIYRRWANKAEVVAEALRRSSGAEADSCLPPDTGSLRDDLLEAVRRLAAIISSEDGDFVAGLMMAMRADPVLAALIREHVLTAKKQIGPLLVARAITRGELAPGTDPWPINETLPGVLFMRQLLTGDPLDEEFFRHLVDDLLLPLLHAPATPAPPVLRT